MGLTMPEGESATNKSGIDIDRKEKMHGQFPSYVLEEAGQTLSRADAIKSDPKLMAAAAEHHASKAEHHKGLSKMMRHHLKRGLVSEKQLDKAAGKGSMHTSPKAAGNRDQSQSKETGSRTTPHPPKKSGNR